MTEHDVRKAQSEEKSRVKKRLTPAAEKLKAPVDTPQADVTGARSLEAHAAMLGDGRLSHPANAAQKARLLSGLQRSYGNAYVQRLLDSMSPQAKLTVSSPDSAYEKEADRVAEAVTRMTNPQVQRQAPEEEEELVQAKAVQRQEEEEEELVQAKSVQRQEEEEEEVQAKSDIGRDMAVSSDIENRIEAARGSGQQLPESVRASFEPVYGHDFNGVRVHADAEANALARQLSARAFTTGRDIFFREGEYRPGSDDGKKLIAHELTHVVQQSASTPAGGVARRVETIQAEGSGNSGGKSGRGRRRARR
ncbi:MAG: hypothetical protein DRI40_03500 [Chloroflexi bacterium]|nr:MAG: hypothetical protein DRI40_03500 [Chloroflexota bacterium]